MSRPIGLTIPVRYRPTFAALARASAEAIEAMISSTQTHLVTTREGLVEALTVDSHGDEGRLEAVALVDALLSLAGLRRDVETDANAIAELIASSGSLDITEEERLTLQQRVAAFLQSESVRLLMRAYDLATEQQATFIDARLISDVRPVFLADPETSPDAALLVHSLKIEYLSDRRHTMYIALNDDDLQLLERIIQKALRKRKELEAFVRSNDIPLIELFDSTETKED